MSGIFKTIASLCFDKKGSRMWDESGLQLSKEQKQNIHDESYEGNGLAIYLARKKKEKDQYYKDLKQELAANLNPKSW